MRTLGFPRVLLLIALVALPCTLAEAATVAVGGQTFTATYNTTNGEVLFGISGTGNAITTVCRQKVGGQWQDVTDFDSKQGTGEENVWRGLDTHLLSGVPPTTAHYKVRFTVGSQTYEVTADISNDGTVGLGTPTPVN